MKNHGKQIIKCKDMISLPMACSITREELQSIEFIGQLDSKFLVCKISKSKKLIVIDQHAADERIKLEELLIYFKSPISIQKHAVIPPVVLDVNQRQKDALRRKVNEFQVWGLEFNSNLDLISVPLCKLSYL